VNLALDFLTELFKAGKSYSSINSARSALSSFLFIKGKPSLLKGVTVLRSNSYRNMFTITKQPSGNESLMPWTFVILSAITFGSFRWAFKILDLLVIL
jgi:hypothetical protein